MQGQEPEMRAERDRQGDGAGHEGASAEKSLRADPSGHGRQPAAFPRPAFRRRGTVRESGQIDVHNRPYRPERTGAVYDGEGTARDKRGVRTGAGHSRFHVSENTGAAREV